ncbi:MAG: circadian clock KaiB family protein [Flavobacterium sp.]
MIHQIVAIPTLIKTQPEPKRIILGDLSDKEKVLYILNISE